MADNSSILSDFGINILEEEIDDVIFQTNEFLCDATFTGSNGPFLVGRPDVYGISRPLLYRGGSEHGLQDDGEA